jgi:hypothetical protein
MNTIYQKMIITRRLVASVGGVLAVVALMAASCSYGKVSPPPKQMGWLPEHCLLNPCVSLFSLSHLPGYPWNQQ